jgi:hypothetical protein
MGVLLAFGHAMWILGHLRQVRIAEDAADLRKFGVILDKVPPTQSSLMGTMGVAQPMNEAVCQAEGVWPSRFGAALMVIVVLDALWVSRRLIFFEGAAWGWLCSGAYALLLALIVYGCTRHYRTWRALEDVLAKVAPLPVTAALERIPTELLTSFKRPWDRYVFEVWQRHCQRVFAPLRDDEKLVTAWSEALDTKPEDLKQLLVAPVSAQLELTEKSLAAPPSAPRSKKWASTWEEFLAMRTVAFVQYIRAHLANFVAVSTAALLPALWATSFYPLRENRFLLMLVLLVTGAVVSVTALVFVQMNRNYVLSKMDRTNPGKVTWDRTFITSIVLHVALPVLALLAVKFPELSRGWSALTDVLSAAR